MRNILHHGPRFAALLILFVFVASLLWQIGPASAVQTFYYQGPPYDLSECAGGFTCVSGSTTAEVTLNVAAGYTGTVTSGIASYAIIGENVGSNSNLAELMRIRQNSS